MLYQKLLIEELVSRGIPFAPWNWDMHDAVTIEVPTSFKGEVEDVMKKIVFDKLNKLLYNGNTTVKLKGSGGEVETYADAKLGG